MKEWEKKDCLFNKNHFHFQAQSEYRIESVSFILSLSLCVLAFSQSSFRKLGIFCQFYPNRNHRKNAFQHFSQLFFLLPIRATACLKFSSFSNILLIPIGPSFTPAPGFYAELAWATFKRATKRFHLTLFVDGWVMLFRGERFFEKFSQIESLERFWWKL